MHTSEHKGRIAVIGSGFGGLAAALRLQGEGFDVTVFEKRDKPGGRAYVYQQDGYTFDAGPTVITAPTCLEELFESTGVRLSDYVELLPVLPMYRLLWEDGYRFDYTNDLKDTLDQIGKKSPGDTDGYRKFVQYTEEVFAKGYEELAHVPFPNWASMIRVAPDLIRLGSYRSVYSAVSKYIRDPHLRQAFSFHSLLVGGNPFRTSAIYTLIHCLERRWGVFFPRGGTGALVGAMVRRLEEMGGRVFLNSEVESIDVQGSRVSGVRMHDGRSFAFDAVLSNADVARTYLDLLRKTSLAEPARRWVQRADYSMSLFVLYFGTRGRFPQIAHHSVMFGPRYKELLRDIFDRGILADDFSLYLHAPTRTDPSLAPTGCDAFYVLSPVPHLGKGDIDWSTVGPKYAERILRYLDERYMPGLRDRVATQRWFTPQDFKTELNAHLGSAFSLEPVLTQSAYFRVHNRDPQIEGLYFVGAGTHPGAGVPGVVSSARATAGLVSEDFGRKVLSLGRSPSVAAPLNDDVIARSAEQCRAMIREGSKSFSLASKLFGLELREAASLLYGWCRHCDDAIDLCSDPEEQTKRLATLREKTIAAFEGRPGEEAVFIALAYYATRYRVPAQYALDLLDGLEMDIRRTDYQTIEELRLYAYRVAGTVGLMMSHAMGVSRVAALKHAVDLGIAMQLTNIARDVREDAENGRVYLPLAWLGEEGIRREQVGRTDKWMGVSRVVERVLDIARAHYISGEDGLKYLPFRAAIAVAAASRVYAAMGDRVRARGAHAWDSRTVVPRHVKLWAILRGVRVVAKTIPYRIVHPWKRSPITVLWRPV